MKQYTLKLNFDVSEGNLTNIHPTSLNWKKLTFGVMLTCQKCNAAATGYMILDPQRTVREDGEDYNARYVCETYNCREMALITLSTLRPRGYAKHGDTVSQMRITINEGKFSIDDSDITCEDTWQATAHMNSPVGTAYMNGQGSFTTKTFTFDMGGGGDPLYSSVFIQDHYGSEQKVGKHDPYSDIGL